MGTRVAILESDRDYLEEIASVFKTKHADKFVIFPYTDYDDAMKSLESLKIDVFLSDKSFDVDVERIPSGCSFAYLEEYKDFDPDKDFKIYTDCDVRTFRKLNGKYQKIDLIPKQIIGIYLKKRKDNQTKVIAFTSIAGGVGNSSIAVACAKCFSSYCWDCVPLPE